MKYEIFWKFYCKQASNVHIYFLILEVGVRNYVKISSRSQRKIDLIMPKYIILGQLQGAQQYSEIFRKSISSIISSIISSTISLILAFLNLPGLPVGQ